MAEREAPFASRSPLVTFAEARTELARLQEQQEAIEKVTGPTQRGEAIRVVLAEYDRVCGIADGLAVAVQKIREDARERDRFIPMGGTIRACDEALAEAKRG